jgi:hypothetical protein
LHSSPPPPKTPKYDFHCVRRALGAVLIDHTENTSIVSPEQQMEAENIQVFGS